MTTDAYIEGFCKVAEECGVDPIALVKRAGKMPDLVRSFARRLRVRPKQVLDAALDTGSKFDSVRSWVDVFTK